MFFVSFIFAQKTVYILNNSTKPVYLVSFKTKPITGIFPSFTVTGYSSANQLLAPGQILILENVSSTTKFPFSFNSTQTSDLFVLGWKRTNNSTSVPLNYTNTTTYNFSTTATQIFDRVSIRVGVGGSLGVGTLGPSYPSVVQGNGWYADYTLSTDVNFPNLQETIITINDL